MYNFEIIFQSRRFKHIIKRKKLEDVIKPVSRYRIRFKNVILVSRSGREQAFVSCKLVTKTAVIS